MLDKLPCPRCSYKMTHSIGKYEANGRRRYYCHTCKRSWVDGAVRLIDKDWNGLECPRCKSTKTVKRKRPGREKQTWLCHSCHREFVENGSWLLVKIKGKFVQQKNKELMPKKISKHKARLLAIDCCKNNIPTDWGKTELKVMSCDLIEQRWNIYVRAISEGGAIFVFDCWVSPKEEGIDLQG